MAGHPSAEVDVVIEKATDWRGETLAQLRAIVLGVRPAMVEEVKWKKPSKPEGVPVWSLDGIVCIGETLKAPRQRHGARHRFPRG